MLGVGDGPSAGGLLLADDAAAEGCRQRLGNLAPGQDALQCVAQVVAAGERLLPRPTGVAVVDAAGVAQPPLLVQDERLRSDGGVDEIGQLQLVVH